MTRGGNIVITITVRECRNVHSPRCESPQCFLRVEHGTRVLGESVRVTCGTSSGESVVSGVEVTLECDTAQRQSIDELIQNPITVSLLEVLPKDKKIKDEQTAELGHATFDLLPLLCGERSIRVTRTLQRSEFTHSGESGENGEIDIIVETLQGILTDEEQTESNVLFLRVRSLHSLPSCLTHSSHNSHFTLSTPHPIPGSPLKLTGGVIKKAESVNDDHAHWKWPSRNGDGVKCVRWAVEDETGELRGPENIIFRHSVECELPHVDWSTELRTWLPLSTPSFLTILTQCPLWPVEIIKYTPTQGGKGKSKEEENVSSHHGVAYLDLSPLLYPGTTRIAGAYTLHPFSEADVVNKIRRDYKSLLTTPSSSSIATKKTLAAGGVGGKSAKRLDSALKLRSGSIVSQISEEQGGGGGENVIQEEDKKDMREGVVYEQAQSYLWVELQLQHSLVPKRPISVLAQRVSEYIPQRPALPRKVGGAARALGEFHSQTISIITALLQEYREMFMTENKTESNIDDRRRQLLYHLNSTGKYHTFKEQLKHAVVGVVRERYGNQTGFVDSAHRHAFLSHLYTYLTDQLHVTINQGISLDDPPETTPTPVNFELLKHFAHEAEDFQDYLLAEKYYKERVSCADHVAQYWYDYGVFCLLIGRLDKAEQCLKEAVSLDQKMTSVLFLYGMLKCIEEQYEEGSEFMELATTSDPTNIIAWSMRGLFYERQNGRVLEEMCYNEAVKLFRGADDRTYLIPTRELQQQQEEEGRQRKKNKSGDLGIVRPDTHGGREGEGEKEVERGEEATSSATLQMTTVNEEGTTLATSSKVEVQPEAPPTCEAPPANVCDEGEALIREDPRSAVFLQTASFLLDVHALKFAEMCLAHVLSSSSTPSCLYYILEARLHIHRQQIDKAQDSLQHALQIDIQSSWAWSLLGHTHFLLEEFNEASEAYKRCLLLQTPPPNQHSVYLHLADIYLKNKMYSSAKEICLRACCNTPSGATWQGVGVACYQLDELIEAESALSEANILNNHDPLTWAYLTLICLKTGRPVEAEQSLKFALKTGLGAEQQEVIQEIRQEMTSHSQDSAYQHIPHLITQLT